MNFIKMTLLLFALLVSATSNVEAQHPIEVERKAQEGKWLEALATYHALPSRRITPTAAIAAGKSAWALGLVSEAKNEYDRALHLESPVDALSSVDRARVLFARGIIEFQERNYRGAIVFVEKADEIVSEEGPLRSEIYQLWGEALYKLNKIKGASEKLEEALNGIKPESKGDLAYLLASAQMQLGKLDEAKSNFEMVPLRHPKSPLAMKGLASIAFEEKHFDEVVFWLNKGREEFSESFLDSWVDYALVKAYAQLGETEELKTSYERALKIYPPSDGWLVLLQAVAEEYLWQPIASSTAMRASYKSSKGGTHAP